MVEDFRLFLEKNNLDRDDYELYDNEKCSVVIGYDSEEAQSRAYFGNDNEHPCIARVYDMQDIFKDFGFLQSYILEIDDGFDSSEEYIYDDYEEAVCDMNRLEGTKLPSIEEIIKDFSSKLNGNIEVEAREEFNNGGEWVSFNFYYRGDLIYDGAFISDLRDDFAEELISLTNESQWELGNGFEIYSIKKVSGFPSWNKSYEVTVEKDDFSTTVDVEIKGFQGRPRNTLNFIKDKIDIDELVDEYNSYCKELI